MDVLLDSPQGQAEVAFPLEFGSRTDDLPPRRWQSCQHRCGTLSEWLADAGGMNGHRELLLPSVRLFPCLHFATMPVFVSGGVFSIPSSTASNLLALTVTSSPCSLTFGTT